MKNILRAATLTVLALSLPLITVSAGAGGHFNPHGAKHGVPESASRHVGDLGNLEADEQGNATLHLVDKHLKFTGKESIIGRAVIIHEGEDDLVSQPTGAAGDRIAAGVIGIAEPDPQK